MRIGEVCLCTNNVRALSDFYQRVFDIDNGSSDEVHQTLISEETQFTIYNDGSVKRNDNTNICLAFTVDDMEAMYQRLLGMGVEIIEKPTLRPWGTINMSYYDPDHNVIYMRSFVE